jgi:putative peptidoglycan lipid II flippase
VVVSALALLTGIFGFFNQVVLAKLFGATLEMDAYLAAMAAPGVLTGIGSSVFTFTIVPTLGRYDQDNEEGRRLATTLLLLTSMLSLLISVSGILVSPMLLHSLAPNLPPEGLIKATDISQWAWLIAGCSVLSSFLISVHYSLKRFFVPSAVPLLIPLAMIISALTFSDRVGVKSVAMGWLAASIIQLIILLPGALQEPIRIREVVLNHPEVIRVLRRIVPAAVALLPFTTLQIIEVFWASKLGPGIISYLGYSEKIVVLLSVATGYGVATVSFPEMVTDAAVGKREQVNATGMRRLRFILLTGVLMSVLIIVLRIPLLQIGFQRGAFDELATQGVASVLPWYLLGMIAIACINLVYRLYYAVGNFKTPAAIGVIMPVVYFGLSGLLSRYWSYIGIGIAFACSWWLVFAVSTLLVDQRKSYFWNQDFVWFLGKLGVAGLGSVVSSALLLPSALSVFGLWGGTFAIAAEIVFVFAGLAYWVLRIPEIAVIICHFSYKCRTVLIAIRVFEKKEI